MFTLIWLLVAGILPFAAQTSDANAQNRKNCDASRGDGTGKCKAARAAILKNRLLDGLLPPGDITAAMPAHRGARPAPRPKTKPASPGPEIRTRLITGLIDNQNTLPETKPAKKARPETKTASARAKGGNPAVIARKPAKPRTAPLKRKLMTGLIVPAMAAPGKPPVPVARPAPVKPVGIAAAFRKKIHGGMIIPAMDLPASLLKPGANAMAMKPALKKKMVSGLISPSLPLPETAPAAIAAMDPGLKAKMTAGFINGDQPVPVAAAKTDENLTTGSIARNYSENRSRHLRNDGPMNLAEIVAKTVLDNPEIGMARAQKKDSEAGVGMARAALFPNIDLTASIGKENTYLKDVTTRGILRKEAAITIKQNLFDFGKTSSDIARSRALLSSAKYRLVDKTDEIVLTIAAAYLDVLEARQFVGVARKNVASHKRLFKLVKANEAGGNATSADTKRVTTRLESAQTSLIDIGSKLQAAKEEFRKITGLYPGRLAPPPNLGNGAFSNNDAEIEARLAENPILLSIQQDIISLRKQLTSAKRSMLPALTFEGYGNSKKNVSGINPRARDFRGMLKISYKLFDGGAKRHGMEQIRARIEENEMRYAKMRQDLLQEYKNSAQSASASNSKAASLDSRLKASKKVMALYIEQFKAGKRTVFELLDAQMDLFNAQSEQISNRYESLRTAYKKLRLNGKLAQTILGYSAD